MQVSKNFQTAACRKCSMVKPEALYLESSKVIIVRCANEDHCALLLGGIRTMVNEQKRHGHRRRRGTETQKEESLQ